MSEQKGTQPALLTIAGYDPTGGAGVLLDTAVFRRSGFPGLGLITAITVQNTASVSSFRCVLAPSLLSQYRSLARDVRFGGIKVGMLGCAAQLSAAAKILRSNPGLPRVVDPVLRSSSGRRLLDKQGVRRLLTAFRGAVSIVTPNLDEACLLSGCRADSLETMKEAAERIAEAVEAAVVIKGGHLPGRAINVLFDGRRFHLYGRQRLRREVHGTGCFFSSTILARLAKGDTLAEAVQASTEATHRAIRDAVSLGKGRLIIAPASQA
jgi:hydroxymethylpyrimidine kinase/phosphomethylpyrimidine kinase